MADATPPSPEDTLAQGDPGDDTANRFRFQYTWAAVVCCMLLDGTEDVEEVFCEHHEDVLLKHSDGSLSGHQVKTRSDDQPPWKAKDDAVLSACARFAKLEGEYPGRFRSFRFLTNHPLHSANNGQSLPYVLQSVTDAATIADLPSVVASWIKRIACDADVDESIAFAATKKTAAKADLPKLRDVAMRLIDTLAQCWARAGDCSHEAVRRAARALIEECGRASALDHEQLLPAYVVAAATPDDNIASRIDGKRMTFARVEAVLEQGHDSTATLDGDPTLRIQPGEGSTELLQEKLDAGGFSAVSRNSAVDLRDKADYLGIRWTKQHGIPAGLARYDHVRTLVLSDAGRAFDAMQTDEDRFGPAMRDDLRRRFRQRRDDGDQLYDASDDHLEGIAFSLTAQCQVVWSHARTWESQ